MSEVRLQPGNKPALFVSDVVKAYTDPRSPLFFLGAVASLDSINSVVNFARREGHPIFFIRMEFGGIQGAEGGLLLEKIPALRELKPSSSWSQFADAAVSPVLSEENSVLHESVEIIKHSPSDFHGTALAHKLMLSGCDTVFVAGFTLQG